MLVWPVGKIKVVSSPLVLCRIENSCHAHSLALPFHRRTLESFTNLTSVVNGRFTDCFAKNYHIPCSFTCTQISDWLMVLSWNLSRWNWAPIQSNSSKSSTISLYLCCMLFTVPCNSLHSLHLGSQSHCVKDYQKSSVPIHSSSSAPLMCIGVP